MNAGEILNSTERATRQRTGYTITSFSKVFTILPGDLLSQNRKRLATLLLAVISPLVPVAANVNPDGSFSEKVELRLPAGTRGMQPVLALHYNSGSDNGIVGMGWMLSGLPTITRVNNGNGIKYAGTDTYASSAVGVLVKLADGTYRSKSESFVKFESSGTCGEGPCSWVATDRSGTKTYYGATADSRIEKVGSTAVRVWAVSAVVDLYGNSYEVAYSETAGAYYPTVITYTKGPGLATYRTVEFSYEGRSDAAIDAAGGSTVSVTQRLKWLTVNSAGVLVRKYRLDYASGTATGRSRLTAVQEYGSNGTSTLPAQTFGWQEGGSGFTLQTTVSVGGFNSTPRGYQVVDVNGDGKADIVRFWADSANEYARVSIGDGSGGFTLQSSVSMGGFSATSRGYQVADVNGDGKADIVRFWAASSNEYARVALGNGSGGFTLQSTVSMGGLAATHRGYQVVDANGDGRADIVRFWADSAGEYARVAIGNGSGGFTLQSIESMGGFNSTPRGYQGVDPNGDGKTDILRFWADTVNEYARVAIGNGSGGFTLQSTVGMGGYNSTPRGFQAVDVNGDGKTDIVRFWADTANEYARVAIGNGSGGFTLQSTVGMGGFNSTPRGYHVADVNGDGKADIVRIYADATNEHARVTIGDGLGGFTLQSTVSMGGYSSTPRGYQVTDINGDGKADIVRFYADSANEYARSWLGNGPAPDLLTSISNGLGGTTTITYAAAPQIAGVVVPTATTCGGGSGAGYGQPCGVADSSARQIVTSVSVTDGRGATYAATFAYGNGRYYPGLIPNQAQLGFAWFTQRDSQTGNCQTTSFYQVKPYQGRPSSTNSRAGSCTGALMSQTVYTYDVVYPSAGTEFVRGTSETKYAYNLGTLAFTLTDTMGYDSYGNMTTKTQAATGLPTVTATMTYAVDVSNWVLDRFAGVETTSGGATLAHFTNGYTRNDLTSKSELSDSVWRTSTMTYDANGNLTSTTDPRGFVSSIVYDATFNAYPIRLTNAKGHVTTSAYDASGAITARTDANGRTTSTTYDVFGRKARVTNPDGGYTDFAYVGYGNPATQHNQTTTLVDTRTIVTREYFDGQGFKYRSEATGDGGQTVIGLIEKDSAGRKRRESLPHFSGATVLWTTTAYDAAGRQISKTLPTGAVINYAYGTSSTTTTDANGRTETKHFNARGKLTALVDALGSTTSYGYDALGRVTSTTLPGAGGTISMAYNTLGQKTSITDPNTGTTTYSYDAGGNVSSVTDAKGQTVSFTYDQLNRVTLKNLPGTEVDTVFTYDEVSATNGIGRLTKKTDAAGTTRFTYDSMGRTASVKLTVDGRNYSHVSTRDYAGRQTRLDYPDGSYSEYSYTDGGNLATVKLDGALHATWTNYNAEGRPGQYVTNTSPSNGTTTNYTYAAMGKLQNVTTTGPGGTLQNLNYTFDNMGDVTGITDNRANKIVGGLNTDETQTYGYDVLGRLTSATGVWGAKSYTYSADGNMTLNGGRSLSYNGQQAVSGTGFSAAYDANGNMTSKTLDTLAWTYAYTSENRISQVKKAGVVVADMVYDDSGSRVKKVYRRPDGTTVTTVYIGKSYEVRLRDGTEMHTINLFGNDQLVASRTLSGARATAHLRTGHELALASTFAFTSASGLYGKINHLFMAAVSHKDTFRYSFIAVALFLTLGFALAFLWGLVRADRASVPRFGASMRLGLLSVLMVFTLGYCGSAGGGGGGGPLEFLLGQGSVYYVDPSYALTGDTLNGLPVGTYFYHRNHVNSSSVITDGMGAETTRIVYTPYGEISHAHSPGGNNVTSKFTGQELDEETGLYYYNARYYDPVIGRFVTADTMVPEGGLDPQGFNRYAYVRNNPINYTDPTGHFWKSFFRVLVAVATLGVATVALLAVAAVLSKDFRKFADKLGNTLEAMGKGLISGDLKTIGMTLGGLVMSIISAGALTPLVIAVWAATMAASMVTTAVLLTAGVNPMVASIIGAAVGAAVGAMVAGGGTVEGKAPSADFMGPMPGVPAPVDVTGAVIHSLTASGVKVGLATAGGKEVQKYLAYSSMVATAVNVFTNHVIGMGVDDKRSTFGGVQGRGGDSEYALQWVTKLPVLGPYFNRVSKIHDSILGLMYPGQRGSGNAVGWSVDAYNYGTMLPAAVVGLVYSNERLGSTGVAKDMKDQDWRWE